MDFDLVIFDCDGVLIDSEPLAIRADIACLAEEGIVQTEAEILERYTGISVAGMKADLERRFGRKLRDDFEARHHAALSALFQTDLKAIGGIDAVHSISSLDRYPCAAASPRAAPRSACVTRWVWSASTTGSIRMCSARQWWRAASLRPTSSSMPRLRWALRRRAAW
jgi:beta-phosphoglucomutase-like phosphatase (HAD superfamily)